MRVKRIPLRPIILVGSIRALTLAIRGGFLVSSGLIPVATGRMRERSKILM
uniref:Uncharacterized protein n=1 Tax=Rhizophora mucronata TaxID=61149 RepID=A0A2P2IZG0_RHIMU